MKNQTNPLSFIIFMIYKRNFYLLIFYNKENPSGNKLKGEREYQKGDIVYLRDFINIEDKDFDLLIPVKIEGKVTIEYFLKINAEMPLKREMDNYMGTMLLKNHQKKEFGV